MERRKAGPERAGLPVFRKEVFVQKAPEEAFRLFTEGISLWWPLNTHSLSGSQAVRCEMECWLGGAIFELDSMGERRLWGRIESWEPPSRLVLRWHHGEELQQGQHVEVRFWPHVGGSRVILESLYLASRTAQGPLGRRATEEVAGLKKDSHDTDHQDPKKESQAANERRAERSFEEMIAKANDLEQAGEIPKALAELRRAYKKAVASEDLRAARKAQSCRCAALVSAGKSRAVLNVLRTLLDGALETEERMRICYHLSRAYENLKDQKKGRFYSQVALNLARDQNKTRWLVGCLNQNGNFLVADDEVEEALECYLEALRLLTTEVTQSVLKCFVMLAIVVFFKISRAGPSSR